MTVPIDPPLALLGGLSPRQFMRRHWQKRPLLVRQAMPGVQPPLARAALFELAGREGVECRLLTRFDGQWRLRHGPFTRRQIPSANRPGWTLLVQGTDLHDEAAHRLLSAFRFVPDACLDDLMVSFASDGGGVGPHLDSYDVFLLQLQGRRRWRWGPVADRRLVEGLPVRILQQFEPAEEAVLEPGDLLYLPPLWGHDGIAEGACMTGSIGFRAPRAADLVRDLLAGLADELAEAGADGPIYRNPAQPATAEPGRLPSKLSDFARHHLTRVMSDSSAFARVLGCLQTEPKPQVWFEPGEPLAPDGALRLDRRTRMAYDERHVFINGEAFIASGRDASLLRALADARRLGAADVRRLSPGARSLLAEWAEAGWLRPADDAPK